MKGSIRFNDAVNAEVTTDGTDITKVVNVATGEEYGGGGGITEISLTYKMAEDATGIVDNDVIAIALRDGVPFFSDDPVTTLELFEAGDVQTINIIPQIISISFLGLTDIAFEFEAGSSAEVIQIEEVDYIKITGPTTILITEGIE